MTNGTQDLRGRVPAGGRGSEAEGIRPGMLGLRGAEALREVAQFREKSTCDYAGRLMQEGWLWNTMVVVARAQSLFELIVDATLHLAGSSSLIRRALGARWEQQVVEDVYRAMPSANCPTCYAGPVPGALEVLHVH